MSWACCWTHQLQVLAGKNSWKLRNYGFNAPILWSGRCTELMCPEAPASLRDFAKPLPFSSCSLVNLHDEEVFDVLIYLFQSCTAICWCSALSNASNILHWVLQHLSTRSGGSYLDTAWVRQERFEEAKCIVAPDMFHFQAFDSGDPWLVKLTCLAVGH